MKMNKKILAASLAAMMMTSTAAATLVSADAVVERPGSGTTASTTGTWYRNGSGSAAKYYFVDNTGVSASGWLQIEGSWYYFDSSVTDPIQLTSGSTTTNIQAHPAARNEKKVIDGSTYRFGSNAVMVTGWYNDRATTPGKDNWEYYAADGVQVTNNWAQNNGKWYWFDETGKMATGEVQIGNKWYKFNNDGSMFTGWQYIGNGTWKYYSSDYGLIQGWINDGGNWYYIVSTNTGNTVVNANGDAVTTESWLLVDGAYKIDGTTYTFDKSGKMVSNATGWSQDGGKWFYRDDNGNLVTGWNQIGGTWYYFAPAATDSVKYGEMYNGGWLLLKEGTGVTERDVYYYVNSNGAMATGWVNWFGGWYYMDASGRMVTGWVNAGNGNWYYTNESGAMVTGWQLVGNQWYYFDAAKGGLMAKGWVNAGGYWYYCKADGSMIASSTAETMVMYSINGKIYAFANDGKMLTGTQGNFVFGADGALISTVDGSSTDGLPYPVA